LIFLSDWNSGYTITESLKQKKQGLISKNRQYVHLSQEQETATTVGRRRDDNPVVLSIDALAAWKDGVKFYHGNEMIWLADSIPANYISTN